MARQHRTRQAGLAAIIPLPRTGGSLRTVPKLDPKVRTRKKAQMVKIIGKIPFRLRVVPLLSMGVIALWSAPAHAYIDPGAGSMFLQLLVAAIAGGLWTLKAYWQRLKSYFTRVRPSEGDGGKAPQKKD